MSIDRDLSKRVKSKSRFDKDIADITNYFNSNYSRLLENLTDVDCLKKTFGSLTLEVFETNRSEIHVIISNKFIANINFRNRLLQIKVTENDVEFEKVNEKLVEFNKLNWFRIKVYLFGIRKALRR